MHDPAQQHVGRCRNLYVSTTSTTREKDVFHTLTSDLKEELKDSNPYMKDFLQICYIPADQWNNATFGILERKKPTNAPPKIYILHNLTKVSIMVPYQPKSRDIVLYRRGGGISTLKDHHKSADPLASIRKNCPFL